VVLIIVCVLLLSWWWLKRDYQTLFTGLEERDAAAIVSELKKRKVPYRIEADGNSIRVPSEVVHETRLALMGSGVNLSGGVGFEIFDNESMGMSEYTQKINYQRALQGELSRTIMAIEDVKLARVHLVLPEGGIFKRDKSKAKGSVSLVVKPGGKLSVDQIRGIQRLVAAAAPGMEPGMVTVLDQRGIALSAATDAEGVVAVGSGQLRIKQEVEQYLIRKAGEVLDRAFGPGQAIVSVDVTLDFDEVKKTVQDIVPSRNMGEASGVMVRRRQTVQRQPGQILTSADEVGYRKADNDSGNSNSTLEIDYEVSRHMQQVVSAPGGIERLSVGVLVPHALGDDKLGQLRALVAMAVGLNEKRGDAIAINGIDQFMLDAGKSEDMVRANPTAGTSDATPRRMDSPWGGYTHFALVFLGALALFGLLIGVIWAILRGHRGAEMKSEKFGDQTLIRRSELLAEVKDWLANSRPQSTEPGKP
jgi:flagellar M-ring protein FliF